MPECRSVQSFGPHHLKRDIGIATRAEREFRIHHELLDPANLDPSTEDYPAAAYSFAEKAINETRKIRSPALKRRELGRLLAKAGRWKELKELLSGVESPKEATDIAGRIKYGLKEAQAKQEHNKAACG